MRPRRGPESATDRVQRLLTVIPWLVSRGGIDLQEAAAELGVSEETLRADLELVWFCGPGQGPGELIDVTWRGGSVRVSNADEIARPLRLGVEEAVTVIVGLRSLLDVPGIGGREAIESALAKLRAAAGSAADDADRLAVGLDGAAPAEVLAGLRTALQEHRRLHLRYFVASRDERTERDVDPMRLLHLDGRWYLEAWCHRAGATRSFRLDQIESLEVLDVDGTPPPEATPRDLALGSYSGSGADVRCTVRVTPAGAWVGDYYPVVSREELDDGGARLVIATADPQWLERLALRVGGDLVVESPPELVAGVRERARAALAAYAT